LLLTWAMVFGALAGCTTVERQTVTTGTAPPVATTARSATLPTTAPERLRHTSSSPIDAHLASRDDTCALDGSMHVARAAGNREVLVDTADGTGHLRDVTDLMGGNAGTVQPDVGRSNYWGHRRADVVDVTRSQYL